MSKKAENLTNKRYGRLLVIRKCLDHSKSIKWLCKCDCGNEKIVSGSNLKANTFSCGCLCIEIRTKHGLARHPLYLTWFNMVRRCGSSDYGESYKNVNIYPQWKDSVKEFIDYVERDLGQKPSEEHSIDRIDNEKGYIPGNLRWATKSQQSNNRRTVKLFTYNGETNTIRYFSDKYGINFNTVRTRLYKGMSICQALQKN